MKAKLTNLAVIIAILGMILAPYKRASAQADAVFPAPLAASFNVDLVGQIGGTTFATAASGNYAYVGIGPRLFILNVTTPTAPVYVSQSEVLPGIIHGIAVSGNYAYVAAGTGGLSILNISNPAAPTVVANLSVPGEAYGVAVSGSYAYVAANYSGLRIINIATPASPIEVGSFNTVGPAVAVTLNGSYAYVSAWIFGVKIVNVSTPSTPTLTGEYTFSGEANAVAIKGSYAYVADGGGEFRSVNITNPANPVEVDALNLNTSILGVVVNPSTNYAYVSTSSTGVRVINITNPAAMSIAGTRLTPGEGYSLSLAGSYLYVADGSAGLQIVRVQTPTNPTIVASYSTISDTLAVAVSGNYAYLANGDKGMTVVDINDPANPVKAGSLDEEGLFPTEITISGDYAYLVDFNPLTIVDISNPTSPASVGWFLGGGSGQEIVINGSYAYLAEASPNYFRVLNISNPVAPTNPGSLSYTAEANGVAYSSGYAYLANANGGLRVINIAAPGSPTQVGTLASVWGIDVAVANNYAYVATGGTGLSIANVSTPTAPALVTTFNTPGYAQGVEVSGSFVYVADEIGGVRIINISDPANPEERGYYDTPGDAADSCLSGGYIFVADRDGGLLILQFTDTGPTYTISGRVVDSTGFGVSGVTLSAGARMNAVTDVNGDYTLTSLGAGTYTITPIRANSTFAPASRSITVPPAATSVNFSMDNHSPVLDNSGSPVFTATLEDQPPGDNTGSLISTMIASTNPVHMITDLDANPQEGIAVLSAETTNGSWEYTLDGGTTWLALGAVSVTTARLLAADAATRLRFLPQADYFGSASLSFRAWDTSSGANGGTANTTANGGTTAFSVTTETASMPVLPVNDPPSFTKGADPTRLEDSGAQTIAGWATGMTIGPANEAGQTYSFNLTADAPDLFSVQPAVNTSGTLTFTPISNAFGTTTLTITMQDNGGADNGGADTSASQTFSITLTEVNDPPSFTKGADQTVLVDSGAQVVTNWAANIAAGPDNETGQLLTFNLSNNNTALFSTQPAVDPSGTLNYTPADGATGFATVTISLQDNGGTLNGGIDTSPAQTFTIHVTGANQPPQVSSYAKTTNEDTALPFSSADFTTHFNDSDAGDVLVKVMITSLPTHGSLALNGVPVILNQEILTANLGLLTYTPALNANGADTFGWNGSDGLDYALSPAQVNLTINPVNDAPVAQDQSISTLEDIPVEVTLIATDVDGDTLSYQIVNPPSHGALTGTAPNLTYIPDPDYNGPDSFTFQADDGHAYSNVAQTITMLTAAPEPVERFLIVEAPQHGILAGQGPDFYYVPDPDYTGPDSFTFRASDPLASSNLATVNITVTAINDPPVAGNQSIITREDSTASVSLTASDVDSATLTFTVVTEPAHGTLSGAAPDLTYTPAADFNGTDSFTFTANDGQSDSNLATINLTITPVNDAPSFTRGADQSVNEDSGSHTVAGWASGISSGPPDEAGQAVHFNVTNDNNALFAVQPEISSSGSLSFTPAADAFGTTIVTVSLQDNGGVADGGVDTSPAQTFSITIEAVNDAPSFTRGSDQNVPKNAGAQTVLNWATSITAGPANEAGQALIFTVTNDDNTLFSAQPAVSASGTLTFTPALDATGAATVTLHLQDDGGTANGGVDTSPDQTFTITITATNTPPVVSNFDKLTNEDTSLPFTSVDFTAAFSDADVANVLQKVMIASLPSTGILRLNSVTVILSQEILTADLANLTYTPNADVFGTDSFGWNGSDGVDYASTPALVNLTVTPVNDAPSFTAGANQTVNEDSGSNTVLNWAADISAGPANESGQSLNFIVTNDHTSLFTTQPAVDSTGALTYTPAANASGAANVTISLHDNGGTTHGGVDTSPSQVFTITINPVNDAPTADYQAVETSEDTAVLITLTAVDLENDPLTYEIVDQPTNGTLTPAGQAPTYTPHPDFNGFDSFTFLAFDGQAASNLATINVTVTPVNDAPVAQNQAVTAPTGSPLLISLLAVDVDHDLLTYIIVTPPAHGTVSQNGTPANSFTYTAGFGYTGPDSFTFKVNDGAIDSNTATVSITVTNANLPPAVTSFGIIMTGNTVLTFSQADFTAHFSDPEASPLVKVKILSLPINGVLRLDGELVTINQEIFLADLPLLTYEPDPDYGGSDSFSWTGSDGVVYAPIPAYVNLQINYYRIYLPALMRQ